MQPNWWDCGVYLLYYVETFLQRPESFQDQFLRKERSLSNYDEREIATMREKLRALIMRLHREQVSKPPARTGSSTPTFGNVNPSVAPKSPVKSPVRSERNKRRTSPGVQKTSVSDTLNGAGKPRRFTPEPKHFQGQDRVSNRTSVYFRETTPAEGYPPEAVSRHSSPRSLRSSSSPSASPTPRKNHSDESRQSLLLDKRKSPSRSTMEEACFSSEVSPKGGIKSNTRGSNRDRR
ncbi:hypothetical protein BDZ91DRAFT_417365 [Kalaharituber pfeilii]|nr:hypothetical protein BDZ91DRAFT_417365 [Kalaharituber pfeilii]